MPYDPDKRTIQLSLEARQKMKFFKARYDVRTYEDVIDRLIENYELYIGHLQDQKDKWFIIWAKEKDEAIFLINDKLGEPELGSLERVQDHGIFLFSVETGSKSLEELDSDSIKIVKSSGDESPIITFNNSIEEWLLKRMKIPSEEIKDTRERSYQFFDDWINNEIHKYPLKEIMGDSFIQHCSDSKNFDELMDRGNFNIHDYKDIEKYNSKELDSFINKYTNYDRWFILYISAISDYFSRSMKGETNLRDRN
jgi:hypothetical protein